MSVGVRNMCVRDKIGLIHSIDSKGPSPMPHQAQVVSLSLTVDPVSWTAPGCRHLRVIAFISPARTEIGGDRSSLYHMDDNLVGSVIGFVPDALSGRSGPLLLGPCLLSFAVCQCCRHFSDDGRSPEIISDEPRPSSSSWTGLTWKRQVECRLHLFTQGFPVSLHGDIVCEWLKR
jgi:hypothetical protein